MNPKLQSDQILKLAGLAPVIPVLVIHDPETAEPLARALVDGGLPVLEVTLRTPAALDVISRMARIPGAHVGAGTVLTPDDLHRAQDAGAGFAVSPGATDRLIRAAEDAALPLLPGAVTASEIMRAADHGYRMLKFFPAEAAGGARALKSLASPLPHVSFCPTGGIGAANAPDYLALPNVRCVGGSWIVPDHSLAQGDWDGIRALAQAAAGLARG